MAMATVEVPCSCTHCAQLFMVAELQDHRKQTCVRVLASWFNLDLWFLMEMWRSSVDTNLNERLQNKSCKWEVLKNIQKVASLWQNVFSGARTRHNQLEQRFPVFYRPLAGGLGTTAFKNKWFRVLWYWWFFFFFDIGDYSMFISRLLVRPPRHICNLLSKCNVCPASCCVPGSRLRVHRHRRGTIIGCCVVCVVCAHLQTEHCRWGWRAVNMTMTE